MHSATNTTDEDALTLPGLAEQLDGQLLEPGDEGFEEARGLWNAMIDRAPTAIARVGSESDVQRVIRFASKKNMELAVRGGGHNVAGTASVDHGIVLDLSEMNTVSVDVERRRAFVGGGATWADVDGATQAHALATPGGVVSDTGVGGLTLGGGIGWLRRRHGMTIDNLVGARLVTADGVVREVGPDNDPALLWALKGGGGNFGVVTQFEFQLHELEPNLAVAFVFYPTRDHRSILRGIRELAPTLPDELAPLLFFGTVPEADEFDQTIWGEGFLALLCPAAAVDPDRGWEILEPLRTLAEPLVDMSTVMAYEEVQKLLDEDYPSGELRYYWKSINISELTDEVVETLADLDARRPSPLSTVDVWVNGGAMARVPAEATAFGDRSERFLIGIEANWQSPTDDDANISWARRAVEELSFASSGREYLNFPGFLENGRSTLESAYGDNYARLVRIKKRVDPDNLFCRHLNIVPAE